VVSVILFYNVSIVRGRGGEAHSISNGNPILFMDQQQDNKYDEYEVIDLSHAEIGTGNNEDEEETEEIDLEGVPTMYAFLIRHSGGLIKDAKQAQLVAVLLIILMNLITFSLITGSGQDQTRSAANQPTDNLMLETE